MPVRVSKASGRLLSMKKPNDGALFLTRDGGPISPDCMSDMVKQYVDAADMGKKGGCHLFRHNADADADAGGRSGTSLCLGDTGACGSGVNTDLHARVDHKAQGGA